MKLQEDEWERERIAPGLLEKTELGFQDARPLNSSISTTTPFSRADITAFGTGFASSSDFSSSPDNIMATTLATRNLGPRKLKHSHQLRSDAVLRFGGEKLT